MILFLVAKLQEQNHISRVFKNASRIFDPTQTNSPTKKDMNPCSNGNHPYLQTLEREDTSKYFVPEKIWPGDKEYPPYVSGGGFVMTRNFAVKLAQVRDLLSFYLIRRPIGGQRSLKSQK